MTPKQNKTQRGKGKRKIKFSAIGYGIVTTDDKGQIVDVEDIEVDDFDDVEIVY